MPHLMLTSALLFALFAIVGIAIGAGLGIAREVIANDADDTPEDVLGRMGKGQVGLAEEFGLGLRHATNLAQDSSPPFRGGGSVNARV